MPSSNVPPTLDEFRARAALTGLTLTPEDIASAFVYLASDDAAWVTGSGLVVDGGLTTGLWGG